MKLTYTFLAICASSSLASAYTLTVSNQGAFGDPDLPLLDNAGNPLTSGVVAVGFFASDEAVFTNSQNFADLITGFTEYGTASSLQQGAAAGLINKVNPENWTVSVPSGSDQSQVGKNIFVVFGNAATLGASDELAVWKSDTIFGTEDDSGNGGTSVSLQSVAGSLLLGESAGETVISAGGGSITYADGIRLVAAVPEPSTSLLAGLAGLALAVRRRR